MKEDGGLQGIGFGERDEQLDLFGFWYQNWCSINRKLGKMINMGENKGD